MGSQGPRSTFRATTGIIEKTRKRECFPIIWGTLPLDVQRKEIAKGVFSEMVYLSKSTSLIMRICSVKRFVLGEPHVTRIYNNSVLILMLGGKLRFMENGEYVELKRGEYYIQQAGMIQEGYRNGKPLLHDPNELPIYFYLEFQGGTYNADESGIPIRGYFVEKNLMPTITACEAAFADRQNKGNFYLLNAHMYLVFSKLWEECSNEKKISNILSRVKQYIESDYASITEIEDIARKFGYHKDHLNKIFKQKYRESLYKYLTQVRMKNAKWLLENTSVCITVRYNNYSAFYRVFMENFHTSPKTVTADDDKKTTDGFEDTPK